MTKLQRSDIFFYAGVFRSSGATLPSVILNFYKYSAPLGLKNKKQRGCPKNKDSLLLFVRNDRICDNF